MPTPQELRAVTEKAAVAKARREELEAKEEARKARELAREQAVQDHIEANKQIIAFEHAMKIMAEDGQDYLKLFAVNNSEISALTGVQHLVFDYFSNKNFLVDIRCFTEQDKNLGSYTKQWLVVSW